MEKIKATNDFLKIFLKIFRMFLILFLIFFRKWCCDDEDDKKTKKTVRKRSKMIQERTKTVRKTETTKFEIICIFTRFLRSCAIIELSTPPPVDLKTQEKKTRKNKVCLKWKISSWRWILSKNRQNRSYPRGVNDHSKFFDFMYERTYVRKRTYVHVRT